MFEDWDGSPLCNDDSNIFEHALETTPFNGGYELVQNLGLKKRNTEQAKSESTKSFENLFITKITDRVFAEDIANLRSKFDELEFKEEEDKVKFDFESENGANTCRAILSLIEKLFKTAKLPIQDREYRTKFSRAYQILYE